MPKSSTLTPKQMPSAIIDIMFNKADVIKRIDVQWQNAFDRHCRIGRVALK
jgi:hypothetical protein